MSQFVTSPIPDGSVYKDQQLAALDAWRRAQTALRTRTGQIWQQYGFKGEFDENSGTMRNVGVDVNNQYGDYQMMLGRQGQELDAADEGAQERGLSGVGLGAQAASRARFLHGRQGLDFGRDFLNQQSEVQQEWQQGSSAYQRALFDAERQATRAAINNRNFNTAPTTMPGSNIPVVNEQPPPPVAPGSNPGARPPLTAYGTQHASKQALAKYVRTHGGASALKAQQIRSQGLNKMYKTPKKGGRR
jgi:hypothetical protein